MSIRPRGEDERPTLRRVCHRDFVFFLDGRLNQDSYRKNLIPIVAPPTPKSEIWSTGAEVEVRILRCLFRISHAIIGLFATAFKKIDGSRR